MKCTSLALEREWNTTAGDRIALVKDSSEFLKFADLWQEYIASMQS
jgi:hypothetical protein